MLRLPVNINLCIKSSFRVLFWGWFSRIWYSLNKTEWICSLFKEWSLEKSEIRVNLEWTFVLFTHFGVTSPQGSLGIPGDKVPCGICGQAVHDDDPAIQCDDCSYWCHISCAGVTSRSYQRLVNKSRSFAWNCFQCGSTNVGSSSSLQGLDFSHSNSFSPLRDDDEDTPIDFPLTSTPAASYE